MTAPSVIAPVVPRSSTGSPRAARDGAVAPVARAAVPAARSTAATHLDRRLRRIGGRRPRPGRRPGRVARAGLARRAPADHPRTAGTLTVTPDPAGDHQVTGRGFLRLPAALRHRCGLTPGDRVVLAADPDRSRLAIYTPAALDAALAPPPTTRTGGDPA